jgi:phage tail-like protein
VQKYVPLGNNDYLPVLPNRIIYDKVTLIRAITAEDSPTVMAWLAQVANGSAGGTAEITLLDSHRTRVTSWKLRGVYPTKWHGPTFDANSRNIALETLELAHEGFL